MTAFSIACGFSRTGLQCIIFRALQGLGAAASVPSAIGVLSTFFVGNEKHRALSIFGAGGAIGFIVGLILSGDVLACYVIRRVFLSSCRYFQWNAWMAIYFLHQRTSDRFTRCVWMAVIS